MSTSVVESAIRRLANTMRIYGEEFIRYPALVAVDQEEAIENLDRAFEAKLEAFHTLYDVSKGLMKYFDHADTSLIIALRNALHHQNHPLFCSLLPELWLKGNPERLLGAAFLLARHTSISGAPSPMGHYIKLDDIYLRLDPGKQSPYLDSVASAERIERRFRLLEDGLALQDIWGKAKRERYPDEQVYLDVMPIFISAVARTFIALEAAGMQFKGFDADTYKKPFTSELQINLKSLEFRSLRMNDLQILLGPKLTLSQAAIEYPTEPQT